jgi:hypothetical protein
MGKVLPVVQPLRGWQKIPFLFYFLQYCNFYEVGFYPRRGYIIVELINIHLPQPRRGCIKV